VSASALLRPESFSLAAAASVAAPPTLGCKSTFRSTLRHRLKVSGLGSSQVISGLLRIADNDVVRPEEPVPELLNLFDGSGAGSGPEEGL